MKHLKFFFKQVELVSKSFVLLGLKSERYLQNWVACELLITNSAGNSWNGRK